MSLKYRLSVVAVLTLLAATGFGILTYLSLQQYHDALHKEQVSSQIAFEVSQRRLLANDYLLYPTQRAKAQWLIKQEAVEQLVHDNTALFSTEQEQPYILRIQENSESSRTAFAELTNIPESGQASTPEKNAALSSLLNFNAQRAITDATKLQEINHNEAAAIFSRLIVFLLLAGTLYLTLLVIGFLYLWRSAEELERLDQAKDEFVSLASHQLRTPLTSIMLNSHMLADGYAGNLKNKQKELLDVVLFSTDRMTELVTVLLNIARLEAGRAIINSQPTDLRQVLTSILDEQKPRAAEKRIKLVDATDTKIPTINTDQSLLKELYANLISNAIKYTPPKGQVTVQLKVEGGFVYGYVRDTGLGIPKNEQGKVFSKFYRGTNVVKKEVVGTGLGLYLLKLIAEGLGGNVGFTSVENKGSEFWFALPLAGSPSRAGSTELEQTVTGH